MSHLNCPECKLVVRWTLETESGYCPRCLARRKTAVVMERSPLTLLRGPEAATAGDAVGDDLSEGIGGRVG